MKRSSLAYGTALALLTVPALFLAAYGSSPGAPDAGTVARIATYTLTESNRISGTTEYTEAPNLQAGGADAARVAEWHSADVFLSTQVETGTLTVTVQFSPDFDLWADAEFDFVDGSDGIAQQPYQRVFTADGAKALRVPVMGAGMRLKLEASGIATATAVSTYRND